MEKQIISNFGTPFENEAVRKALKQTGLGSFNAVMPHEAENTPPPLVVVTNYPLGSQPVLEAALLRKVAGVIQLGSREEMVKSLKKISGRA